jgi:hypothetical protein
MKVLNGIENSFEEKKRKTRIKQTHRKSKKKKNIRKKKKQ